MNADAFSLLAPITAIVAALLSRNVALSLLLGIFVGALTLYGYPFIALYESSELLLSQFQSSWKIKTLFFVLMVGGIMHGIEKSGAIEAFIQTIEKRHIRSKKAVLLSGYSLGLLIFLESSITALVIGALINPLKQRYHISNEKLAYLCDSTASPVCSLFVFNAWGALLLGLVATQIDAGVIQGDALSLLAQAIFFNFYAIFTLLLLFLALYFNINLFAMRQAEEQIHRQSVDDTDAPHTVHSKGSIWQMILPIFIMLLSVPAILYITGHGNITQGDGSDAIFYAVLLTLIFMVLFYKIGFKIPFGATFSSIKEGMQQMLPIALILLCAFALGDITVALKTGHYLASLAQGVVSSHYVAALIFIIAAIMSFATGTSWGTFSIMMPIAIALSAALNAPISLSIAAVISGGLFGDHASPISDTTIISSMAAKCEVISHVKTQLPYALLSATLALIAFIVTAFILNG